MRALAAAAASDAALERFRQRVGPELAAAADGGAVSSVNVGRLLRGAAEEELKAFGEAEVEARAECAAQLQQETDAVLAIVSPIEEGHRERQKLKAARADILAVGFQTTGAENQEFASLIVCATAGIFAVSIHWGFFSIWAIAYMLYRRSTKQTRTQRAASDDLQGLVARLREVEEADREHRAALKARAEAWSAGRAS